MPAAGNGAEPPGNGATLERTAFERSGRKSGEVVVDHFPVAVAVSAGMPLEQALSRQAGAVVLEADEPHYRRVFRQVLGALQGIGDRVEDAGLGIAYVAMEGLETMYGGEERLVCALLNAVPRTLLPRAGIGEGKFAGPGGCPRQRPAEGRQGAGGSGGLPVIPLREPASGARRDHIRPAPVRAAYPGPGGRHGPGPDG